MSNESNDPAGDLTPKTGNGVGIKWTLSVLIFLLIAVIVYPNFLRKERTAEERMREDLQKVEMEIAPLLLPDK